MGAPLEWHPARGVLRGGPRRIRGGHAKPVAGLALVLAALAAAGCRATAVNRAGPPAGPEASPRVPQAAAPRAASLGEVVPVAPVLRVMVPDASAEVLRQVRDTPGVAGAARVALANVSAQGKEGPGELSVAAVEPLEFRPLAPRSTAAAEFVWHGLLRGEIFLAHEEQAQLGVDLGSRVTLRGPGGEAAFRVGGLAANGVPNLAGGLLSLERARAIGLSDPALVLVGAEPGAPVDPIRRDLADRLPAAQVQATDPLVGQAFLSGSAAARAFGSFTFKTNPDGTITPDAAWVRKNITTREVPILGRVTCHRLMFPQLSGALGELERAGLSHLIDVPDYRRRGGGCYEPRFVDRDPNRSLSRHAWGIAIDLNKAANPEGGRSRQDPRLVATFERWGFRWGGYWSLPDPMHFELAALLKT